MRKSKISGQEITQEGHEGPRSERRGLARFVLGPVGRILIFGLRAGYDSGFGHLHLLLRPVFPPDRREAARRPVRQHRQDLRRAGVRWRWAMPCTPDEVAAELRRSGYSESRGNPVGYYQLQPRFHRDLSRAGLLLRPGSRRHQVRRRQDLADHLPAGQHPAQPVPAGAAAHHQPLRPEPREAPHGEVPRHPQGAGRRGHLGRGQALLPALRLRPDPHRQGGLRGSEGRAQGAGRLHAEPAAGAHVLAGRRRSAGRASWPR